MKQLILFLLFLPLLALARPQPPVYVCPPCGACDSMVFHLPGNCPACGMKLINRDSIKNRQISICFFLYDGVEVLDFAGPMEVFSYAGFRIFTVAKKKEPLLSQRVLKIIPDYSIADAPPADIFAVFGGNDDVAANDSDVIKWIQLRDTATQTYFSVCTGAFILGKAGLLDSLTVTTFHRSIESLQRQVPGARVLPNVRYVDNGRVITTAGISAGIDGALHLVARLKGQEAATKVAIHMEYDKYVPEQGLVVSH
nr:DJ-1/PfpI family protein [Filimonas zeae]